MSKERKPAAGAAKRKSLGQLLYGEAGSLPDFPRPKPEARSPAQGLAGKLYATTEAKRLENDGRPNTSPTTSAIPASSSALLGRGGGPWDAEDLFERLGIFQVVAQEPAPTSIDSYATAFAPFARMKGLKIDEAAQSEIAAIKTAMLKVGIASTRAQALVRLAIHAIKHGPYTGTHADTWKWLETEHGGMQQARAAVEDAKRVVREAEKVWPGARKFLDMTGIGTHPAALKLLCDHAKQQKAKAT